MMRDIVTKRAQGPTQHPWSVIAQNIVDTQRVLSSTVNGCLHRHRLVMEHEVKDCKLRLI